MASETKLWLLVLLLFVATYIQHSAYGEPQVKCFYIFGDSLSDSGNNNNLPTSAKANYPPYGIDFPNGATGRFTNGLTTVDRIGQLLSIPNFIPPFANTSGSDILKGVNYASGGGGIRDDTSKQLGAVVSLGSQLINHNTIVSEIALRLGGIRQAQQYLNKCLYYVNIGINDYVNNYFMPQNYPTSRIYTPDQYARSLNQRLSLSLKVLRDVYGARKFAVFGIGLIGCTPYEISRQGTNGSSCVEEQNRAIQLFNERLRSSVDELNQNYPDSRFIFVNSTAISSGNPRLSGFTVVNASCCPTANSGFCIPYGTPCQNRNQYVFYDEMHPSQAFNDIIADGSYNDPNHSFTHPMDINQLAQSQL